MYAPCYRWSLCDSYGGILSQMVLKETLNGHTPITEELMQELIQYSNFADPYCVNFTVSF